MRFRICYHDRCFDGAASAALLARFIGDRYAPDAIVQFTGLKHLPDFSWRPSIFDGDENAIVDFRYCPYPEVAWWFDHHQSAFLSEEDERHFKRTRSNKKVLDVSYSSCARLIADSLERAYGYRAPDLRQLIEWADIVDGAKYPNAHCAIDVKPPMNRLKMVLEHGEDPVLRNFIVGNLRYTRVDQLLAKPAVRACAERLVAQHHRSIALLRERAEVKGRTVFFDLSEGERVPFNKFVPYYLFPEARYVVALTRAASGLKISLGANPWTNNGEAENLAALAEHFGGGGHPYVAGIALEGESVTKGRVLARSLLERLRCGQEALAAKNAPIPV